jgi:hypothetical protein
MRLYRIICSTGYTFGTTNCCCEKESGLFVDGTTAKNTKQKKVSWELGGEDREVGVTYWVQEGVDGDCCLQNLQFFDTEEDWEEKWKEEERECLIWEDSF